jgi:2-haloacid dehalogenase
LKQKMKKNYLWLLFDADDTLFDYPAAEAKALAWTFEELGLAYLPDYLPVYHKYNRQVWQEFEQGALGALELRTKRFGLLFDALGIRTDPHIFSPIYLKNLARGSDLLPGVEGTIRSAARHRHIGIVTNGLADVQRPRLQNSPIQPFIEKIFISEEMGVAKPETAFFDRVFESIGRPERKQVLIIGDSLTSDMLGGIQYGLDTCWFNPAHQSTELPVTYQIHHLPELIQILDDRSNVNH